MGCTERLREVSNELIQYPWIHVLPVCSAHRRDSSPRSGALRSRPHPPSSDAAGDRTPAIQVLTRSFPRSRLPSLPWSCDTSSPPALSATQIKHKLMRFKSYHYHAILRNRFDRVTHRSPAVAKQFNPHTSRIACLTT